MTDRTPLHEQFQDHLDEDDADDFVCLDNFSTEQSPSPAIKKPRRKINYEQIRAQYLIGKRELHEDGSVSLTNYTIKELCIMHQAYYPLVKARSAKEKWSLQRAAYKARLQENAENTALNIYLHEGAIADTQAMIATNKLNKIYKMALSKYDSVIEAYDSDRALDDDERIDVKELKDLLAIGKDLHTLSQQVVKSRTAQVDASITKDLRQYAQKRQLPRGSGTAHSIDPKTIEKKITALQNILAPAQKPTDNNHA